MSKNDLSSKMLDATKWSSFAEITAKLVTPISSMILARLLTPETFGIVATVSMIYSFADIFSDAGFQKYLIQHKFLSDKQMYETLNVAFWTNLLISIFAWTIIALFRDVISSLVGIPGYGSVISVSCLALPLTSFSSIQMAFLKKKFDFKKLFNARIVGIIVPFCVTIPLALIFKNYWSIIIGTLSGQLINAIVLTVLSDWKPKLYYSFIRLREMLSFSIWTLLESVLSWLGNYGGIFIIGQYLSAYYIGLYRTSINISNSILSIIISATLPVLFTSLSYTQANKDKFFNILLSFQKNVGLFLIPLGVGIFLYRDFVTSILLGKQWAEAADFIGIWSFANVLKILLSSYNLEAIRALGKPKISVVIQTIQVVVMLPLIQYGAKRDFNTLFMLRSSICILLVFLTLVAFYFLTKESPVIQIKNLFPYFVSSFGMFLIGLFLKNISNSFSWNIISIFILVLMYIGIVVSLFPDERTRIKDLSMQLSIKKER